MKELKTREKDVLRWIIRSYVNTALPVSSHHLVKNYRLNCSSATVRNDMANLEKSGYIKQPHTSAGRVPTDKGYRFYVDSLMKPEQVNSKERARILSRIEKAGGDIKLILEEASRILGRISKELGVVLTPWISWGIFDRLELIGLTQTKVLVVIHVRSRLVKTVILEVESNLTQDELEQTAGVLNERLSGLMLEEIQHTIRKRMRNVERGNRLLTRRVVESASTLFDFSEPPEVHTCGTQNILIQPEFSDVSVLEHMFTLIDDRKSLIHLFHRKTKETRVTIGQENEDNRLESFAIISSCYTRGRDVGTLGVIGPTRMRYRKILPLVNYMAKTMSRFLS